MTSKLLAEWFWTDRWMGSSGFLLPMEARGVYREMLTQAWRRGAKLPNDHEAIQRAIGATCGEWDRSWPRLQTFWRVDGVYLVNDTQVAIFHEAGKRADATEQKAKLAAQARWKDKSSNAQAYTQASPQAQPVQSPPSPSPSPSPISETVSLSEKANNQRNYGNGIYDQVHGERAGRLVEHYGELFLEHRSGARYRQRPSLDWQDALTLVPVWDDARLEKLAVLVLTTDDPWISQTDRGFKIFALKASWADDRLRAWETEHGMTS